MPRQVAQTQQDAATTVDYKPRFFASSNFESGDCRWQNRQGFSNLLIARHFGGRFRKIREIFSCRAFVRIAKTGNRFRPTNPRRIGGYDANLCQRDLSAMPVNTRKSFPTNAVHAEKISQVVFKALACLPALFQTRRNPKETSTRDFKSKLRRSWRDSSVLRISKFVLISHAVAPLSCRCSINWRSRDFGRIAKPRGSGLSPICQVWFARELEDYLLGRIRASMSAPLTQGGRSKTRGVKPRVNCR